MKVETASAGRLRESLRLLEASLRGGEQLSRDFVARFEDSIKSGKTEVLIALEEERVVGILVLDYRLNVSLGGLFASIEDLYVDPRFRGAGVGRALLDGAGRRCSERGISYVEAQVEDDGAKAFYAECGFSEEPGVRVFSRSYPLARGEVSR